MIAVDLDKVLLSVCQGCNEEFSEEPCEPGCCRIRAKLEKLPRVTLDDLRPKGRWVEKEESLGWGDVGVAECSVCEENWVLGEWSFEEFAEWNNFCPSCGADMRGGGEDER